MHDVQLTDALVTGMQEFSEGGRGSLGLDGLRGLFVLGQFTEHTSSHALDVFHWGIQQLEGRAKGSLHSLHTS